LKEAQHGQETQWNDPEPPKIGADMPENTPEAPNLPSSSADEAHISSADVPADPAASASAEIFAAMNGSTLTDAGDTEEYGGEQSGIDQQVGAIEQDEPTEGEAPPQ
jgi:hypothetical protein